MKYRSLTLFASLGVLFPSAVRAQFLIRDHDDVQPSCTAYDRHGQFVTINAPNLRCVDADALTTSSGIGLFAHPPGPHQLEHLLPASTHFNLAKPIFAKTESDCFGAFLQIGVGNGTPTETLCETKKTPKPIAKFQCDGKENEQGQQDCVYLTPDAKGNWIVARRHIVNINPHP